MPIWNSYVAHPAQQRIHAARDKRFRTVCTGRRFGKTYCLAGELLDRGGSEKGGDYGWVAPTYNVADRGIEAFRSIADGFVVVAGRAPSRIEFQGLKTLAPTRVWFLSADNPDSIRGFGFQGLVIDEAASIPQDVWHYVLRPTISQTLGWAVFVSTPKGRNWFYDLFTRGQDPTETDYASFTFPSKASPYFPEKEWEEAKRTLPEDVFRQEYMAEFMEDSAGVFRGIDGCLQPQMDADGRGFESARQVVIGCDIAKHTDWTVLIAMDAASGRCFAMERFNQLDWRHVHRLRDRCAWRRWRWPGLERQRVWRQWRQRRWRRIWRGGWQCGRRRTVGVQWRRRFVHFVRRRRRVFCCRRWRQCGWRRWWLWRDQHLPRNRSDLWRRRWWIDRWRQCWDGTRRRRLGRQQCYACHRAPAQLGRGWRCG